MNITVKINDKPTLPTCKFNCDIGLHSKLNNYEVTSYMNGHETNCFIGKPKSGKTSLIYSFFKSNKLFKKTYHNIFIFQPTASRFSMNDKLFDSLPSENIYEELNEETLSNCINRVKEEDKEYNNCIIFDDVGAYLKDKAVQKLLKELIFNRRHIRTSVFFLVQSWMSIPMSIRKLFSNIFIFKVSKNEMNIIFDEVIEHKKEFIPIILKTVYNEPYKWLFVNTTNQRLYDGFDEIILND